MKKVPCFLFGFFLEHTDETFLSAIPFLSQPEYEEDDMSDMQDKIIDKCDEYELEHIFGVHDVTGGEIFTLDGVKYEALFSFCTYEVEENRIPELMKIWREILDSLGFITGEIVSGYQED